MEVLRCSACGALVAPEAGLLRCPGCGALLDAPMPAAAGDEIIDVTARSVDGTPAGVREEPRADNVFDARPAFEQRPSYPRRFD